MSEQFKSNGVNNEIRLGANVTVSGVINGDNNRVIIADSVHGSTFRINISGSHNTVVIDSQFAVRNLLICIGNHVKAHNAELNIGSNFSIEPNGRFYLYNSGNRLEIGSNCMFSNNVTVRCGESPHLIFDLESGDYLDKSDGVFIGEHVWVGEGAYITKAVTIADECVIGACSVVTRRFSESHVVLAGNPAKIVKRNVQWIRNRGLLERGSNYKKAYDEHNARYPHATEMPTTKPAPAERVKQLLEGEAMPIMPVKRPAQFIDASQMMRVRFDDFIRNFNAGYGPGLPGAARYGWVTYHEESGEAEPLSAAYHGSEAIGGASAPPLAGNTSPKNWLSCPYNQPFNIPVYQLQNARVLAGGFRRPQYGEQMKFGGRLLGRHQGTGCLLLEGGELFEGSFALQDSHRSLPEGIFSYQDGNIYQAPLADKQQLKTLAGNYYYLGNMLGHFGHFILDGMSRLWLLKYLSDETKQGLKFICFNNPIPGWAWDLLAPFGISIDNVIFLTEDMLVENLIVPLDAYTTHVAAHGQFQSVLNTVREYYAPSVKPSRKIYLSRKNQAARRLVNEPELEAVFSELGFEIIIPEQLSIAEQVQLSASASILVGETGSGMYLAGFQQPGTKTVVLAPKSFLLFDDYILAAIGQRHIKFMLGEKHVIPDDTDRWTSHWTINFDESLLNATKAFVDQP